MSYEIERVAVSPGALRLSLNEITAGCSPAVHQALGAVTREQVAYYPTYEAAVAAVAARLKVPVSQVQLTNGLDEGIMLISLAALRGNRLDAPFETIIVPPAFDMYPIYTEALGGRIVGVPAGRDLRVPVDRVRAAIGPRTRLVWITNPNNPSGLTLPRADILGIAAAAPHAVVVVDEAYADFAAGESLLDDPPFEELPNVIVGRTFSKAYGLAGLRAGALVGAPAALEPIRRIVPPYSLNVCAAAALPAACADGSYYGWYLDQVRESKDLLYAALERLDVEHWRSAANFVLARFGDAAGVVRGLSARGVLVRDRSNDPACPGCVRITTGVVEHTRACIAALEETLCGGQ